MVAVLQRGHRMPIFHKVVWFFRVFLKWSQWSCKTTPFYLVKNSSVHSDSFRCISLYMLMSSAHPAPLFCGRDPSLSFNFLTKPALNCPSFRKQSGVKWFALPGINEFSESEVKWHVAKYVTHTLNLCSAFNPSKCTHTAVRSEHTHTHTPWTHTQSSGQPYCCDARGAVGGLVPCSRVSPQSWYWGWRECWLFTPTSKWLDNWDCLGFWGIKKRSEFLSL